MKEQHRQSVRKELLGIPLVLDPSLAEKKPIMISHIDRHLSIGEQSDAESPPSDISAVFWTALDIQLVAPPNVLFARLPLKEYTEPALIDLEMGVEWLARHRQEHNILVACRQGLGRSASIMIAYLCCKQGLPYAEALHLVSQKRPRTTPLPYLASRIEQLKSKTSNLNPPTP